MILLCVHGSLIWKLYIGISDQYGQYSYFEYLDIVIFKLCLLLRTTQIYQERKRQDIQLLKQA